jgi:2-oxoglutarate dehydrogenase E2 component (dihydrolipoamide succinyltransferase)
MPIELRVPEVGESISEVQIGDWLKQVGDLVERDEPLVVIETDKVTVDLLAPERGRLSQIVLRKGADAKVRDLVGWLDEVDSTTSAATTTKAEVSRAEQTSAASQAGAQESASVGEVSPPAAESNQGSAAQIPKPAGRDIAGEQSQAEANQWQSPSVRRARAEMQARAAQTGTAREVRPPAIVQSEQAPAPEQPLRAPTSTSLGNREEEVIAMTPFRRTIAERLVQSKNSAALLTTFNEVDLSMVQELRHTYQDAFLKRHKAKLGLMSFFVKAAVEALKQIPVLNAEIRGNDIVYKNYYDIGVAVGGGRGLVVPVIRNAEYLGLAEIERTISEFAARAKDNKLQLAELVGGTFTVSNGGVYGSMLSTPIINPPQSGILGLHAIQDRPVAHQGQVVIRPMMYIALTYDHRIVDGREAVTFLRLIKDFVEQPARILLEV